MLGTKGLGEELKIIRVRQSYMRLFIYLFIICPLYPGYLVYPGNAVCETPVHRRTTHHVITLDPDVVNNS